MGTKKSLLEQVEQKLKWAEYNGKMPALAKYGYVIMSKDYTYCITPQNKLAVYAFNVHSVGLWRDKEAAEIYADNLIARNGKDELIHFVVVPYLELTKWTAEKLKPMVEIIRSTNLATIQN